MDDTKVKVLRIYSCEGYPTEVVFQGAGALFTAVLKGGKWLDADTLEPANEALQRLFSRAWAELMRLSSPN